MFGLVLVLLGLLIPFPDQDTGTEKLDLQCPVELCIMRKVRGFKKDHKAIDLEAPVGAPVYAAHSGIVREAGWWCELKPCAVRVVIEGYNGESTGYFHLQDNLTIRPGDKVYVGDRIGRVGMTGRTSFPHVHMWLELYGRRVDPCTVLDVVALPYAH